MSETVKTSMSRSTKIIIATIAVIMSAMIVSFVILAFIPVRGFNRAEITDYLYVNIYDAQSGNNPYTSVQNSSVSGLSQEQQQLADMLQKGLESSQYSAFRAAFEFNYKGHLRMDTYTKTAQEPVWDEDTGFQKKDKDGALVFKTVDTVYHTEIAASEIVSKTSPAADRFVLEFVYGEQRTTDAPARTIDVTDKDGKIVSVGYDTMRVTIFDSNNTISEFAMYFYDRAKLFSDNPDAASETIPVILVRANTSTLYDNLVDISELVRTGKVSE